MKMNKKKLYLLIQLFFYNNLGKNKLAKLKNRKKPNTSVAVVKNIEEDKAGSTFSFSSTRGIISPKKPDITKFPIIAKNIIIPKNKL